MITLSELEKSKYKNVWVVAELQAGIVLPLTAELIGTARRLADKRKSEVWTIVIGATNQTHPESLFHAGSDTVLVFEDAHLIGFNDELEANLLSRMIRKYLPEILLCGATSRGRAMIPRVAVETFCGLTADCTDLDINLETGDLLQTRPAFGGNILATIRSSNHRPQMATVRPKVMIPLSIDATRTGRLIYESVEEDDLHGIKTTLELHTGNESTVNLSDAEIIIAGGRAMKGKAGFDLLREFAALVDGEVGASRAGVDNGWISYAHQIGQTGQTVQTKIYISCGISGQIHHLIGMQSCDLIIAIDINPDTPMMQLADIAIVGNLFEILPKWMDDIRSDSIKKPAEAVDS